MKVYKYWVISLLLFLTINLPAQDRNPDWNLIIYTNSTVAYCIVYLDGEPAEAGDLLGAFSGDECRGIGTVFTYQGSAYAVMNIQGESAETISFLAWDASMDLICEVEETIQSWPGHDLGYPPDFIIIDAERPGVENLAPEVNFPAGISFLNTEVYNFSITDYITDNENDNYGISWSGNEQISISIVNEDWSVISCGSFTQVYGYVMISGENAPLDSEVGIFVGEECRGVSGLVSLNGRSYMNTSVQGNHVEEMHFKLRGTDEVIHNTPVIVNSNPGGMVGYPTPLNLNFIEEDFSGYLSFTTDDWTGEEAITFYINDYSNPPVPAILEVEVFPGNHAPVLDLPESITFEEDESLVVDFGDFISDPDGDNPILFLETGAEHIFCVINGYEVVFSSTSNWSGSENLVFGVEDESLRLQDTDAIQVIVTAVNDAPVLEVPAELILQEDESYQLDLSSMVYDLEGDALEISWQSGEELSIEEAEIDWEPVHCGQTMTVYGIVHINGASLSPQDPIGAFVNGECRGIGYRFGSTNYTNFVTYTEVVEPMTFMILDVSEDIVYAVDLEIMTVPGGIVGYPPNFLPLNGTEVVMPLTFILTPEPNWNGITEAILEVSDSGGLSSQAEINVLIEAVNDLPEINLPADLEMSAGSELILDMNELIFDIDGDDLEVTAENEFLLLTVTGMLLHIEAGFELQGDYQIQITVSDGTGCIETAIVVTVIQQEQAPVLNFPSEILFEEDTVYIFNWQLLASDPEGEPLTISWTGNDTISIITNEVSLLISAPENWNGIEEVIFIVSDGELATTDTVAVYVTAVNDLPEMTEGISFEFDEDQVYESNLWDYWQDVDSEDLSFSVETGEYLEAVVTGFIMTIVPAPDWNGNSEVTVRADDGNGIGEGLIEITVLPVEDAPWLALPAEIVFNEDDEYVLNWLDYCGDVDGDAVFVSAESEIIQIGFTGEECSLQAPADWNGSETVTFFVNDTGQRLETMQDVLISVTAVNDAPVLNLPESLDIANISSEIVDMSIYCSDIDSEELLLTIENSEHIAVEVSGLTVEFTAEPGWTGSEALECELSDGELSVAGILIINVYYPDYEFSLDLPDQIEMAEDTAFLLELEDYLVNENGAGVTVSISGLSQIVAEVNGLQITLLGNLNWYGIQTAVISLINQESGAYITDSVVLNVSAVNDAPVLNLPAVISFAEDTSLFMSFRNYCSDVDNSTLIFGVSGTYPHLNLQVQGYNVLFSASLNYFGEQEVVFSLSDGVLTVYDSVNIIVTPVNDPPNINLPNWFYLYEDANLTVDLAQYILEYDNDELTVSISGNTNIFYEIEGLQVTFTSTENWNGSEVLTVSVEDGQERLSDSDNVGVVVLAVNDAPVIDLPENISFNEDESYALNLEDWIYDVENTPLVFNFSSEDLYWENTGGELVIWGEVDYYGEASIQISASDGVNNVSEVLPVLIAAVNDSPVLWLPESFSFNEDTVFTAELTDYAEDVDNE
ncbi:MAG: tandem-95 repeat protein, partial [Candidatus Cloacimonetes bacterium]|nr:tandem-95 repeat protein [Candidatus Cloacimonadota bacterium]